MYVYIHSKQASERQLLGTSGPVPSKIFFTNNKWDNCNFRHKICQAFNQWGANGTAVVALRHKTGSSGFHSRQGFWKFSSDLLLRSAFSSPGVHSASNRNEYRPARKADKFAVLVVPNVKVRMEAQNSVPLSKLHYLLRKSYTLFN
jgi:hypothetical protein